MNSSNISQINIITQDAKVGAKIKKGYSLNCLIDNLIREHGQYRHGSYSVDATSMPISDKRLLLSHFESAEWYEYACKSHLHTESLFSEHKDHIQKLIDEHCYPVYVEDMEEMRAYK